MLVPALRVLGPVSSGQDAEPAAHAQTSSFRLLSPEPCTGRGGNVGGLGCLQLYFVPLSAFVHHAIFSLSEGRFGLQITERLTAPL